MIKLKDLCIDYDNTLMDALKSIDANGEGIVFIQKDKIFIGTLTDGDIRRALISGATKESELGPYCNKKAIRLPIFSTDNEIQKILDDNEINMLPLVNREGVVVDFATRTRFHRFPVMEPCLQGKEREYVNDCIDTNWISSQGSYVERFESELSAVCEVKSCLATSSGTTALHLALKTLDIGFGDEVIVPNLTFGASVNAILHAGATPVLVDVSENDWTLCPQKVIEAISPNTKALMPVHLYGNPCQMKEIMKIATQHGLLVIEDCAEALGAKISGKPVGSFGDAAAYSFFANKVITCGEGGAVMFRDSSNIDKAKMLRDHGMSATKKYWHELVGYNYRMTNIQAAIGCAQLEKLEEFAIKRSQIWTRYEKELLPSGYFKSQKLNANCEPGRWLFTLVLSSNLTSYRDQLSDQLRLSGIDTRPIFYPMSDMPAFQTTTRQASDLQASQRLSRGGISFPSSMSLNDEEIILISERTIEIIEELKLINKDK